MDPDSQIDYPHSYMNGNVQNGGMHNGSSHHSSGGEEMNGEDDARHTRARSRARDRGPAVVKGEFECLLCFFHTSNLLLCFLLFN